MEGRPQILRRDPTLRFIVERYPSSRFSEMAKVELGELGITPPAASGSAAPAESPK